VERKTEAAVQRAESWDQETQVTGFDLADVEYSSGKVLAEEMVEDGGGWWRMVEDDDDLEVTGKSKLAGAWEGGVGEVQSANPSPVSMRMCSCSASWWCPVANPDHAISPRRMQLNPDASHGAKPVRAVTGDG
jgi:hypothetical protein